MYRRIIHKTHHYLRCFCLSLIRAYQLVISPFLGYHCRFYPSCSEYAKEAFSKHTIVRAGLLTGWRLLRCHPFCKGGHDPVP